MPTLASETSIATRHLSKVILRFSKPFNNLIACLPHSRRQVQCRPETKVMTPLPFLYTISFCSPIFPIPTSLLYAHTPVEPFLSPPISISVPFSFPISLLSARKWPLAKHNKKQKGLITLWGRSNMLPLKKWIIRQYIKWASSKGV